jgi:hypothetical protein
VSAQEIATSPVRLEQLVRVTRVLPLENRDLALGAIGKAFEEPGTGHIFVSDSGWSSRVYRFDSLGRFVRAYRPVQETRRREPHLIDFAVDHTGVYLLTQFSLEKLRLADGALAASAPPPQLPLRLTAQGGGVCVFTTRAGLACYDDKLRPTTALATVEQKKLARYIFAPPYPLATTSSGLLALAEFYSPTLWLYEPANRRSRVVTVPGSRWNRRAFDELWQGRQDRPLGPGDENKVRQAVRRFDKVLPLPDGRVVLYDTCWGSGSADLLLLDPQSLEVRRYPRFIGSLTSESGRQVNILDLVVGTSAAGVLGRLTDNDAATALSTFAPAAAACRDSWQCLFFLEFARR